MINRFKKKKISTKEILRNTFEIGGLILLFFLLFYSLVKYRKNAKKAERLQTELEELQKQIDNEK